MTPPAPNRHRRRSKSGVLYVRPRSFFLGTGCRLDGPPSTAGTIDALNCVVPQTQSETPTCGCVNAPPLFAAQSSDSQHANPAKQTQSNGRKFPAPVKAPQLLRFSAAQRPSLGAVEEGTETAFDLQTGRSPRAPREPTCNGASRPTRSQVGIGPDRPIFQGPRSENEANFLPLGRHRSYWSFPDPATESAMDGDHRTAYLPGTNHTKYLRIRRNCVSWNPMSNTTTPPESGGAPSAPQSPRVEARTATKHWHPALMETSLRSIKVWLLAVLAGEGADRLADGLDYEGTLPVLSRTASHALHAITHVEALRNLCTLIDEYPTAKALVTVVTACYEPAECCDLHAAQFDTFLRSLESCLQYLQSYLERCPHDEPRVRTDHAHFALAHLSEIHRWKSGATDIISAKECAKLTAWLIDPQSPETPNQTPVEPQ